MKKTFTSSNSHGRPVKSILAALLATVLLTAGCNNSAASSDRASAPTSFGQEQISDANNPSSSPVVSEPRYYSVTESLIPDPQIYFEENYTPAMVDDLFAEDRWADAKISLSFIHSVCAEGRLFYLYKILVISEEYDAPIFTTACCLCVLDAPYEQWEYHILSSEELAATPEFTPLIQRIAGVSSDGLYLQTTEDCIGFYNWDGSYKLLEEIDMDSTSYYYVTVYPAGETLYVVTSNDYTAGSFTSYNQDLQPVLTQNLENRISGLISRDSEYLWYGFDENRFLTVWDKPNGTQLYSLGDMLNNYFDFRLTQTSSGEFVLADTAGVWTGDGSSPLQKTISFADLGYTLQELFVLNVNEDGSFSLVVRLEDTLALLTLRQTEKPADKQEITVVSSGTRALESVVAAFNRQNNNYRVILVNPYDSGDIDAYCRQLQLEISAGRGPDLVDAEFIDKSHYIENGYIAPLDGIMENPSDYWTDISDTYSISYGVIPYFLAVSKSLAGDLTSWNTMQMMEAVQNSPAEALQMGITSMDIVMNYGLTPGTNPQFIDYEAGVSRLTEQPFLDFLEFAKNYDDDLYYSGSSRDLMADYYGDGRIAAYYLEMYTVSDLLYASACFQGQEVLIGMPAPSGRSIYLHSRQMCLISNSHAAEGAKEFLRYLISAEGQLRYFQQNVLTGFSCRRDVTETLLEDYQRKAREDVESGHPHSWNHNGLIIEQTPLTEEQISQFWALFEDAKRKPQIPSEVAAIIQEELAPYFAGSCSAEEAAGKLHNRVQLYLDEAN